MHACLHLWCHTYHLCYHCHEPRPFVCLLWHIWLGLRFWPALVYLLTQILCIIPVLFAWYCSFICTQYCTHCNVCVSAAHCCFMLTAAAIWWRISLLVLDCLRPFRCCCHCPPNVGLIFCLLTLLLELYVLCISEVSLLSSAVAFNPLQ